MLQDVNAELANLYSEARLKLLLTEVYDGESTLRANALTEENGSEVEMESQNIMGRKSPRNRVNRSKKRPNRARIRSLKLQLPS
ncbi:hypothetical protein HRED_11202 [Candidatus Haloredivivus sp. G17]|nr:hypothetical protein HRED_11202 [Candidatus Haloredivivus sp. G17]